MELSPMARVALRLEAQRPTATNVEALVGLPP
jgi:hypothetical protein